MREENYFEKKLETSKETLAIAQRKIEHLDLQMLKEKERFDYNMGIYNAQIIHMQNIVKNMEERIPELEKKLEQGYKVIDIRTGKAYKSFKERHEGQLQTKIDEADGRAKAMEERYAHIDELREKKKKGKRLKDMDMKLVEAEEIRESLQPKDEIAIEKEKRVELLKQKREALQQQLEELQSRPIEDPAPIDTLIKEKESIADEMRTVADAMNGEAKQLAKVVEQCQDIIEEYAQVEGGHAIWQGRLTKGFVVWCEEKGYTLPE